MGWLIQVFCTYVGYILLFTGVFWATQLHKKFMKKWRQIRGHNNLNMENKASTAEGSQSKKMSEDMWERVGSNNNDLWGTLFLEQKNSDPKEGPKSALIAGKSLKSV